MKYIDIHTHKASKSDVIQVNVREFSKNETIRSQFDCIGIHPWSLPLKDIDFQLSSFAKYIEKHRPWMLGEMGLDRTIQTKLEDQISLFSKQIQLATKYNIEAIVIHSVKAYSDVLKILIESKYQGRVLLHDFNSTTQTAEQYLKHFETFFSFGEKLFHPKTSAYKCFKEIDLNLVFFETDDNLNLEISDVYKQGALIRDLDNEELKSQILRNLSHLNNALFTDSIN